MMITLTMTFLEGLKYEAQSDPVTNESNTYISNLIHNLKK